MIVIRVNVPVLDRSYDVKIDENMPVYQIQEQMTDLICMDQQCSLPENSMEFLLWNDDTGRPAVRELSAWENGIVSGTKMHLA